MKSILFANAVVAQLAEHVLGKVCPLSWKLDSVSRITVKGLAHGSDRGPARRDPND